MRAKSHNRIDAIDGMRAIAVVSVILYHVRSSFLPAGFIGVDIFFVLSGYVVCRSLLASPFDNFLQYISSFYVRRLVRIYPAFVALLITTLIFSRLFIPDSYLSMSSNQTGLFALFGVSNFQLILETNGYFGAITDFNPYVHTWSLGVEEQFYVIFPLVLFLEMRLRVVSNPVVARCGSLLLPTLLVLSLGFSAWETMEHPDRAYFMLSSRFWELAAGSILCMAHSKGCFLPRTVGRSLALVLFGLGCIGVGVFFTVEASFPFPWAIAPVLGSVACLAGVVVPGHRHLAVRLLSLAPVAYVGRISYSLYLWHWPVIVLLRWTVGLESPMTIAVALVTTVAHVGNVVSGRVGFLQGGHRPAS